MEITIVANTDDLLEAFLENLMAKERMQTSKIYSIKNLSRTY